MSTAMLAVICTSYIIIVGRMLVMRAGILCGGIEQVTTCQDAAPYRNGAVLRRISRWASVVAYCIGLFVWGAAAGVVLSVVLQWYWAVCW